MLSTSIYSLIIAFGTFLSCHTSNSLQQKAVEKSTPGIRFIEEDWSKALKAAHDEKKLVFLDIYATWCGPCKMLKQYTFTDSAVGHFFNNNFINITVDGEKGVGPQLAQQYSIEGYPTLIVADATGKPVLMTSGYIPADVLMQFGNEALKRGGQKTK